MKKVLFLVVAACFLVGLSANVNAASVNSQLFPFETNLLSDNNAEELVNMDNGVVVGSDLDVTNDFIINVGDRFRGSVSFGTVEDLTGGGGTNPIGTAGVNELSGIFDITALSVTADGGTTFVPGFGLVPTFDIEWGPTPSFQAEVLALTGENLPGVMVALFEDPTPDYERTFTAGNPGPDDLESGGVPGPTIPYFVEEQTLMDTATDGIGLWAALGFTGVPLVDGTGRTNVVGEGWLSTDSIIDVSIAAQVPSPTNAAIANFALNRLDATGLAIPVGLVPSSFGGFVNVNGSTNALGTLGVDTPFPIFSNSDLVFTPIPEPTTMLLLGTGLIGLAAFGRRKFFKKG